MCVRVSLFGFFTNVLNNTALRNYLDLLHLAPHINPLAGVPTLIICRYLRLKCPLTVVAGACDLASRRRLQRLAALDGVVQCVCIFLVI